MLSVLVPAVVGTLPLQLLATHSGQLHSRSGAAVLPNHHGSLWGAQSGPFR